MYKHEHEHLRLVSQVRCPGSPLTVGSKTYSYDDPWRTGEAAAGAPRGGGVRAGARLEAGASCELGGSWSLFNVFSVS